MGKVSLADKLQIQT